MTLKLCKRCRTMKNIRGKKELCKRCNEEFDLEMDVSHIKEPEDYWDEENVK